MKLLCFHSDAFEDYINWEKIDKMIFNKINSLIKDILRTPFSGIGKPEPLKYQDAKYWSRRITDEHRLVYQVLNDMIIIISCKEHYNK